MNKNEIYDKIWAELRKEFDYAKGDDVLYLHFAQACESVCDVDEVNIDDFEETYNVNIG